VTVVGRTVAVAVVAAAVVADVAVAKRALGAGWTARAVVWAGAVAAIECAAWERAAVCTVVVSVTAPPRRDHTPRLPQNYCPGSTGRRT